MTQIFERIVSVALVSLSVILLIISVEIKRLNRTKGIFSFILSLLFTGISCYYFHIIFCQSVPSSILKKEIAITSPQEKKTEMVKKQKEKEPQKEEKQPVKKEEKAPFFVYIKVSGETLKVASGDEVEIHKDTKFKIERIETKPDIGYVKGNFVGFVPKGRKNTGQDVGYWISYKSLRKNRAIDKSKTKFELVVKKGKKILGKVYFKFI